MKINGFRSDLQIEKKKDNKNSICISFTNVTQEAKIKQQLLDTLLFFLKKEKLPSKVHFFVVGLGNDNFTSDSVGPKVLKNVNVNAFIETLGFDIYGNKISALEPGALIETGIDTAQVVKSVVTTIKPQLLICIDAFVCQNSKYLNHTIEVTNKGIIPGSGLKGNNQEISKKTMGIPVLTIGIPTCIELVIKKQTYLLSTKDIDEYVLKISKIIGETLNELLPTYGLS